MEEKKQTAAHARGVFDNYCPFSSNHRPNNNLYYLLRRGHRSPSPKVARTLQVHIIIIIIIWLNRL